MCGAACSLHCILASGGTGVAMHPLVQGLLPVRRDRRRAAPSTVGGGRSPACERLPAGDGYEPLQQLLVEHNNAPYCALPSSRAVPTPRWQSSPKLQHQGRRRILYTRAGEGPPLAEGMEQIDPRPICERLPAGEDDPRRGSGGCSLVERGGPQLAMGATSLVSSQWISPLPMAQPGARAGRGGAGGGTRGLELGTLTLYLMQGSSAKALLDVLKS